MIKDKGAVGVVIVAAGRGRRAQTDRPKQFCQLGHEPVLSQTMRAFLACSQIDHLVTVIHCDDEEAYQETVKPLSFDEAIGKKLSPPVFGGETRCASAYAGLEALKSDQIRYVLIHDAVRPLVSDAVILRVINRLREGGQAVIPGLPVNDTLKRTDIKGQVTGTVERSHLWSAQTPQGFAFSPLLAAHQRAAKQDAAPFTDDAAIAEWAGMPVEMVLGDYENLKLTRSDDFVTAHHIWKGRREMGQIRIGFGYDVHSFCGEGSKKPLILGGVILPDAPGLSGHSDADVVLHALCDAIYGALAQGDIGAHFPPSDEKWRGADSAIFARHACQSLAARGAAIVNLDVTIICETPKIDPYRQAMREKIAALFSTKIDHVSVKATTNEGLGAIGRGEGIAANAIANICFS